MWRQRGKNGRCRGAATARPAHRPRPGPRRKRLLLPHRPASSRPLSTADHQGSAGGLWDGFGLASPWVSPSPRDTPIKSGLDVPMASAFSAPESTNPPTHHPLEEHSFQGSANAGNAGNLTRRESHSLRRPERSRGTCSPRKLLPMTTRRRVGKVAKVGNPGPWRHPGAQERPRDSAGKEALRSSCGDSTARRVHDLLRAMARPRSRPNRAKNPSQCPQ
jgi:hypothetical protein